MTQIDLLIELTESDDPKEQNSAIHQLLELGAQQAAPQLLRLLNSTEEAVREAATHALGYLGFAEPNQYAPAICRLLADESELVRSTAIETLRRLGFRSAERLIRRLLLADNSGLVRATAAETLGEIGSPEALDDLEQALNDSDEAVGAYAASSMGLLGTPEMLPRLLNALARNDSTRIRVDLLGALYRLGSREALKELMTLLTNSDEEFADVWILNTLIDIATQDPPDWLTCDGPFLLSVLNSKNWKALHLAGEAFQLRGALRLCEPQTD